MFLSATGFVTRMLVIFEQVRNIIDYQVAAVPGGWKDCAEVGKRWAWHSELDSGGELMMASVRVFIILAKFH